MSVNTTVSNSTNIDLGQADQALEPANFDQRSVEDYGKAGSQNQPYLIADSKHYASHSGLSNKRKVDMIDANNDESKRMRTDHDHNAEVKEHLDVNVYSDYYRDPRFKIADSLIQSKPGKALELINRIIKDWGKKWDEKPNDSYNHIYILKTKSLNALSHYAETLSEVDSYKGDSCLVFLERAIALLGLGKIDDAHNDFQYVYNKEKEKFKPLDDKDSDDLKFVIQCGSKLAEFNSKRRGVKETFTILCEMMSTIEAHEDLCTVNTRAQVNVTCLTACYNLVDRKGNDDVKEDSENDIYEEIQALAENSLYELVRCKYQAVTMLNVKKSILRFCKQTLLGKVMDLPGIRKESYLTTLDEHQLDFIKTYTRTSQYEKLNKILHTFIQHVFDSYDEDSSAYAVGVALKAAHMLNYEKDHNGTIQYLNIYKCAPNREMLHTRSVAYKLSGNYKEALKGYEYSFLNSSSKWMKLSTMQYYHCLVFAAGATTVYNESINYYGKAWNIMRLLRPFLGAKNEDCACSNKNVEIYIAEMAIKMRQFTPLEMATHDLNGLISQFKKTMASTMDLERVKVRVDNARLNWLSNY